ncbi:hypothetical protein [Cellulomonas timonensis]|uniref:hypothetical protein n=1 Tax=Cellulomonas timonensis TaxID=1689271 RepID=UPI000834A119|nr:hypothetical protein [Cellulomonas timonensis]
MLDDQQLYPPATYPGGWAVVGAALIVLAVLVPIGVRLYGRPLRLRMPSLGRRSTLARRAAVQRIDQVEAAHRDGVLDAPGAASELSQIVREFAAEWSGVLYSSMTLTQLEATDVDASLRTAVTRLSAGAFGASGESDVPGAARVAREVVLGWNRS